MRSVLHGIRVVEVAQYVFVPVATAVLAEWGADVIKVEPPETGDAYRGLRRTANLESSGPVSYAFEHANRSKRSVGIDLGTPGGREVLGELVRGADVFVTNLLPASRRRLGIEAEALCAVNPRLVYARGTALGDLGDERERGGYDHASYWARSGSQCGATPAGAERPSPLPGGGYGDSAGGAVLAGAICAALLERERTGSAPTVDLSLLGMGMWSMGLSIAGALMNGEPAQPMARVPAFNPLAGTYRSADGRWVVLGALQGFAQWPALARALGHPEWLEDARFDSREHFEAHAGELATLLDAAFAEHPLAEWRRRLAGFDGVWDVVQDTLEAAADPQAVANGHVAELDAPDGSRFSLVTNPVRFDAQAPRPQRAPEAAQHTEEVLLELGFDWQRIAALKEQGAVS